MKLLSGLNRDVAHVDQPAGTYRRARNMVLDDLAGAMANELAPELLASYIEAGEDPGGERFQNMELCGRFEVPGDRIIFAVKARESVSDNYFDPNREEQILELNNDGTFTELAVGPAGTFTISSINPFQGVGYVNGANDLVLVYTDGATKPRYIVYKADGTFEGPFLIFPEAQFPMARPKRNGANDTTGDILVGNYSFVLAYEVQSNTNNLTQFGPAVGAFQIGAETTDENKRFRGSASMKFYGLDTNYEYVRVYAIRNFNGVEYVTYADRFFVSSEDMEWSYIGQEQAPTLESTDSLLIPRVSYNSAETLTVSDDRLFMANLTSSDFLSEQAQAIANGINVYWTVDEVGMYSDDWDAMLNEEQSGYDRITSYPNANWSTFVNRNKNNNEQPVDGGGQVVDDWGGMLGGFMPNEVYALYIAFMRKDGTWTQAYHIPAGGDDGDFSSDARENAASFEMGSRNLNAANPTAVGLTMHTCGKTGYVENESETYTLQSQWTDFGLGNNLVRHHLMPSPLQMWQSTVSEQGGEDVLSNAPYATEWCNQTCGLYFDNVVIPEEIADLVQGYQIFYAKANTINDRRVKAYAPTWRWQADNSDGLLDALRIYDPYLLAAKPEASGWTVEEVYKQMNYLDNFGGWSHQSATVEEFAYLPANVLFGDFDNEYREPVLAFQLNQDVDYSTGWNSGYPGYVSRLENIELGAVAVGYNEPLFPDFANYGWHSQAVHDTLVDSDSLKDSSDTHGVATVNFASALGTYHDSSAATPFVSTGEYFTYEERPDKSNPNYTTVNYATTVPGTGLYYNALDSDASVEGSGLLPAGTFLGWGGIMGSFSCIYEDSASYFEDYAGQDLVAMNDLVRVNEAGTYQSNQPVRGGDTWITPVVVEFMAHDYGTSTVTPRQARSSNDDDNKYRYTSKISYFTWSHIQGVKNDLAGVPALDDLIENWGEGTTRIDVNGEHFNTYNFGQQWFKQNELKSAFPHRDGTLESSNYPNRIIRSARQNYESNVVAWSEFATGNYYDNALSKESIRNIEDYQGDLIIHHGNGIFKTRSKFNIDASGTNVFVGSGDIFQAEPMELFVDAAGYAGIEHWSDSLLSRVGYTWVDRNAGRVFNLSQQLEELSAKGLRNWFRDSFVPLDETGMVPDADNNTPTIYNSGKGGFTIGFDPINDRMMFTKRYCESSGGYFGGIVTNPGGWTVSYSLRNQCWVSDHSYQPYQYFQSYNTLYAFNEVNNGGIDTFDATQNRAGMFRMNTAAPGTNYQADGTVNETPDSSYVEPIFNMGGNIAKLWQNFNWVTRVGEGEGLEERQCTFDCARVYNDHQLSFVNNNFRLTDNKWQWNEFRDDSLVGANLSWFDTDDVTFLADAVLMDATKQWHQRQRMVSPYIGLRLETLNTDGNRLYLLDVSSTARKAIR